MGIANFWKHLGEFGITQTSIINTDGKTHEMVFVDFSIYYMKFISVMFKNANASTFLSQKTADMFLDNIANMISSNIKKIGIKNIYIVADADSRLDEKADEGIKRSNASLKSIINSVDKYYTSNNGDSSKIRGYMMRVIIPRSSRVRCADIVCKKLEAQLIKGRYEAEMLASAFGFKYADNYGAVVATRDSDVFAMFTPYVYYAGIARDSLNGKIISSLNIYEQIVKYIQINQINLKTLGSREFSAMCIKCGCDFYKSNEKLVTSLREMAIHGYDEFCRDISEVTPLFDPLSIDFSGISLDKSNMRFSSINENITITNPDNLNVQVEAYVDLTSSMDHIII